MLKRWAFHSAAAEVAHTYIIYIHTGREKIIHKDASARGFYSHYGHTSVSTIYTFGGKCPHLSPGYAYGKILVTCLFVCLFVNNTWWNPFVRMWTLLESTVYAEIPRSVAKTAWIRHRRDVVTSRSCVNKRSLIT